MFSQVRNVFDNLLVPLSQKGDILMKDGTFFTYKACYGLILHYKTAEYALPFIVISRDTTKPWLLVLNGGPGNSNLKLSFNIDTILNYFQILFPGYRGVDDNFLNKVENLNDKDCKKFVHDNKSDCNNKSVVEDIELIMSKLKIDSIDIVAHSYGGMIASELYNLNKSIIRSAYVFSPVSISNPVIDNNRVYSLFDYALKKNGVNRNTFFCKLNHMYDSLNYSKSFIFGVVSQLYKLKDIKRFIYGVSNNVVSVSDLITQGGQIFNKKHIVDFALKFGRNSNIGEIPVDSGQINFSEIFKDYIYSYNDSSEANLVDYPNDSIFIYFLPRFEIYKTIDINRYNHFVLDGYAHSDIWVDAPKILKGYLFQSNIKQ